MILVKLQHPKYGISVEKLCESQYVAESFVHESELAGYSVLFINTGCETAEDYAWSLMDRFNKLHNPINYDSGMC